MNKIKFMWLTSLLLVLCVFLWFFWGLDSKQRLTRSMFNAKIGGNYIVTYTNYNTVKVWEIKDGKVTSEPDHGYYFFWSKGMYIQTPIPLTVIEETK